MKAASAFEICHEVYLSARIVLDNTIATRNVERVPDYLWRPRMHAHLAEYVADFGRAGQRTLLGRRLDIFEMYYMVDGVEWQTVCRKLRLGAIAFTQISDEVKTTVGKECKLVGLYPPRKYFSEQSEPAELVNA